MEHIGMYPLDTVKTHMQAPWQMVNVAPKNALDRTIFICRFTMIYLESYAPNHHVFHITMVFHG